jgi:chromosomal replication initiator protein
LYAVGLNLNPHYTFENFVVGDSNKIAYSIAKCITEGVNPDFNMNPFFLYGAVGLGKTHLMQAMAWELKAKHKDKNIVYLSAEKFMYLFVQALQNKTIDSFKEQFKNIDLLFVDDIQFIAGKDGTQREFFYTINTLLNDGKKIIMACDRLPEQMKDIGEQLRSRMSSGVMAEISLPDYETRLQIAKMKAKNFELQCDDKIFEYIAKNVKTTCRDVEGAVKKLLLEQKFGSGALDLDTTRNLLLANVLINSQEITLEKLQRKVADYFEITREEILSSRRDRKFSFPRQIAFYLAKKLTTKSYAEIGKEFGNKNHATVLFAYKKIEKEISQDAKINEIVLALENLIKK